MKLPWINEPSTLQTFHISSHLILLSLYLYSLLQDLNHHKAIQYYQANINPIQTLHLEKKSMGKVYMEKLQPWKYCTEGIIWSCLNRDLYTVTYDETLSCGSIKKALCCWHLFCLIRCKSCSFILFFKNIYFVTSRQ